MAKYFIAYPRDYNNAFPAIKSASKWDAVAAGLRTGKPFDVHASTGRVVWTWEQRP